MSISLNLSHATGTLYPNPMFGEPGEAPYVGFVMLPADVEGKRGPTRLAASAWQRPCGGPHDYILEIGDGLRGAMSLFDEAQRGSGCPDFEGAVGLDWELCVDGWFYEPVPGGPAHIHLWLYTLTKAKPAAFEELSPLFF
jgi:hypothetical protein